ncbi:ABC transporter permease [Jannaschia sp. LMIT008]|uniref:ABC transporter permease n=1 Tax=Jannaschia maritima TaxID=3032585 RepID=UPI0028122B64|nr:ABC transporter permease [Jannaschia sp. LMIT008]
MTILAFVFAGILAASLPLLLAALGEMVVEKTGLLNLGIEGMMALGAAVGFVAVYLTGSHVLGLAGGALAAALLSLAFAGMVLGARANQVAAGLAVGVLGLGLSALFGASYESFTVSGLPKLAVPALSDLPVLGGLFRQDVLVWAAIPGVVVLWWVLERTKAGLVIRAVGENADAARAIGYDVVLIRAGAVAFGGAMAGLGGAYASTVLTPLWAEGMIAGRGWIALALVVFGTWRTGRVTLGALLFGTLVLGGLAAQAAGARVPSQLLASLPYLVTIVMLCILSAGRRRA